MGVREFTEETLGVHRPYEAVDAALTERVNLCKELDDKRREYGVVKHGINERELEVINDVSGESHASATARKEAIKDAIAADGELRKMRLQLDDLKCDLDSIEDDLKGCDQTIQAHTARMNELGGLLHLYAATKQAGVRPTSE